MNYSAMIQNRRSVHAFREKEVPSEAIGQLRSYYEKTCPRLVPEIATELIVLDKDAQPALESSAGYNQFLIGAPHYLLLMSAPHSYAAINAGYMMEDLVLKLTELDIDTCWMTFTDSDKIKKALSLTTTLEVAAIVAFGYGEKTAKKLRLNILSMSQIDVRAEQQYYAPKKGVNDLVHMGSWSNKSGLDEMMDFYDDMLWQSFYAASLSPSYLNRQPYGFLVQDHSIYLVQQEDAYTDNLDAALDLGIVMLHFSAVASQWAGQVRWELSPAAPDGLRDLEQALTPYPRLRAYSVAGNCDYGALEPMDGLAAFDQTIVFYTHGHMYGVKYDLDTLTDAAAARGAELALFGHTHVPHAEQRGKVFLFNPGSCGRCYTGPDTYGLLTLENGKVTAYEHKEVPKQ